MKNIYVYIYGRKKKEENYLVLCLIDIKQFGHLGIVSHGVIELRLLLPTDACEG